MSFGSQPRPSSAAGSGTLRWPVPLSRSENILGVCVHLEQKSSNNLFSSDSELAEPYSSGTMYGNIEVTIHKQKHSNLGLTISGGADRGYPPRITTIKPGSIADKSDCVLVNDVIRSINGSATADLTHEQIVKITKNADSSIRLGLEYVLTDSMKSAITKHAFVHLEPVNESFGITVRGGLLSPGNGAFPLTVRRIRPRSCADKNGCLKQGDRILAIDGVQTRSLTCEESMKLLSCHRSGISLFTEYDIADLGSEGRQGTGPFEIEIEMLPTERLGANLVTFGENLQGAKRLLISHIQDGSIADRCGALQVGDLIESINGINAEELSLQEAIDLLSDSNARSIKLRILPCPEIMGAASTSLSPAMVCGPGLCRTEEVEVVLEAATPQQQSMLGNAGASDSRRRGANPFGFSLQPASPQTRHDEPLTNFPLIASVIPGGPAFQSGVIQAGDSLLAIQGDSPLGKTIDKLTARYLSPSSEFPSSGRHLSLVTQYTVAENVIPSSGVFDEAKNANWDQYRDAPLRQKKKKKKVAGGNSSFLACHTDASLLSANASRKSRPGEPLLISKVIPGSVASRCGSITPGDILLAVNGVSLEACSITDAARLLQTSEDIVTLRIQKPDEEAATPISDEGLPSCCQSDLEIIRDDDNEFNLGGGGALDMNDAQEDEFLSQSADESISHLPGPPPRPPRRYRSQKTRRMHRHLGGASRIQQQLEIEVGSDNRRANPSDSLSSDRFSENMCSDTLFEVHKVRLTRSHPSCPWGVVISGTDDVIDAPVYIDSLTPGKPAAISGLLRRGDRILAVNGLDGAAPKLAGGAGLTLSLVTARLQQPFESVTLYIAREKSRSDFLLPSSSASTSAIPQGNSSGVVKQYSWGTSGSPGTEFSPSFDDDRIRPSPRAVPSTSSAINAAAPRLKKQNSTSKVLPYPRQPTGIMGFPTNSCRDSNFLDDYDRNFGAASYRKFQTMGHSTGNLPEVPRQTVDAYLSKDDTNTSHHQRQHQHHHRHKSHSRRRKAVGSSRHQHRHGKQNEQEQDIQKEREIPRASSTLNLDDISCPGCREAVVNEVLNQQRLLNEQRPERNQIARRRNHLRTRGRSLELVDSQDLNAITPDPSFPSSYRTHHRHHQHQQPRVPSPLEIRGGNGGSYQNLSRSDSRLNRERPNPEDLDDEEGLISSSSIAGDSSRSSCSSSTASGSFTASSSCRSSSLSSTDFMEASRTSVPAHRTITVTPLHGSGKQRSHRSTETLPRGAANLLESRNTALVASRQRLHRSASRENRVPSWRGWIRLVKPNPGDSFGIGLSKGLSSRGIYVSAIRPGSIADTSGLLQIYDRILKVNEISTKGRTCREVVAMIRRSSPVLDLLVHRRR
ncbi:hypothetical protein Aperf_G00000089237 [Anoplocephala perfoliata]